MWCRLGLVSASSGTICVALYGQNWGTSSATSPTTIMMVRPATSCGLRWLRIEAPGAASSTSTVAGGWAATAISLRLRPESGIEHDVQHVGRQVGEDERQP